jgi:Ca2+-binding EF-hand superfamily protein
MNILRKPFKRELDENDIEFIMANTDFEREKILAWYEDFREKCPDYQLTKRDFIDFYKNLIPGNNPDEERFCEAVFQACDADKNGYIDFAEFMMTFWINARGNLREKLSWLFDVYDTDRTNYITQGELGRMLRLVFNMKCIKEDPYKKAEIIFSKVDRSQDGRLTKQEFIAGCTSDESLRKLLAPF